MDDSVFIRTLRERYAAFRDALVELISRFAQGKQPEITEAAKKTLRLGELFRDNIAVGDRPKWLDPLIDAAFKRSQGPATHLSQECLTAIIRYFHCLPSRFEPDDDSRTIYNFDAIYSRYRDEYRIPELFDQLVELLVKIIESGEIESVTALNALRQLLDTLKANRDGSYVAASQTIRQSRYVFNLCIGLLKCVPVLKVFVEAYEKTQDELEAGFEKVNNAIDSERLRIISETIPRLERLANASGYILALPPAQSADGESRPQQLTDDRESPVQASPPDAGVDPKPGAGMD